LSRRIVRRPKRKINDNIKIDIKKIKYKDGRGWRSLRAEINCKYAYFWREILLFSFFSGVLIRLFQLLPESNREAERNAEVKRCNTYGKPPSDGGRMVVFTHCPCILCDSLLHQLDRSTDEYRNLYITSDSTFRESKSGNSALNRNFAGLGTRDY
jgi:hypothetical protein